MKIKLIALAVIINIIVFFTMSWAVVETTVTCDSCWRIIPGDDLVYYVDVHPMNGFIEEDRWPTAKLCELCIIPVEALITNEN